jgi:hypothetical protein
MEAGLGLDDLRVGSQPAAAFDLDLFQRVERGEDPIGEWLVGKGPEPLCGLHLWGIRWQEHQVDPLRQLKSRTAVPSGTIQHQHDVLVWPCSHLLGKSGQGKGEDLNADCREQQPTRPPALGMHKGKDVHPFITLGYWGFHRCTLRSPDASQDRLEANPMLIHGPEFSLCLRVLVLHQSELVWQFFYTPVGWPHRPWHAADEARGCCDRVAVDNPIRAEEPLVGLIAAATTGPLLDHSTVRRLLACLAGLLPVPPEAQARAEADSHLFHGDDPRSPLLPAHSSALSRYAPIGLCSQVAQRSPVAFSLLRQPQNVPMRSLHRIFCLPISLMQLFCCVVCLDFDSLSHTSFGGLQKN